MTPATGWSLTVNHAERPGAKAGEAARANEAARRAPYVSRNPRLVATALVFAVMLFVLSWYRHATYRSGIYDMAVFDQAIWLMAHGKAPFITMIGRNIFLDHFSPVLVLFVPLYLIAATPAWLLVIQSMALGIGLLALAPLLDELGLSRVWRVSLTIAYLASTLIWNAALYDFHPSTLAVPVLLAGLTAALRDDRRGLVGFGLAALLFRDDLGLSVVAMALVGYRGSRSKGLRVVLSVAAIGWVLMGSSFGIVFASPRLWHDYYGYLGPTPWRAVLTPWLTIPRLVRGALRADVLRALVLWLLPFGFLPLLRPGRVALGLLWAAPLIAAGPRLAPGGLDLYHYGAPIFPFLLVAAASGVSRLPPRAVERLAPVWLASFTVLAFSIYSPIKFHVLRAKGPDPGAAAQAVRLVGPSDGVSASDRFGPHVSHRTLLLPFPFPFVATRLSFPLSERVTEVSAQAASRIDVVIVDIPGGAAGERFRASFARLALLKPFHLVFDRDGVLVYRRQPTSP